MTADNSNFYMVWGRGCGAPTVQHGSFLVAEREATRLARANPGIKFFLLRAEKSYVVPVPDVVCETLDEIPF